MADEKEKERERLAEEKEAERQRLATAEALDEFRKETLRRTVAVTVAVRRVPLLVSAHRTYKTYDEQMRAVIDAYLDLRAVRHEVDNPGVASNAAFCDWNEIRESMDTMEDYLGSLCEEFAGEASNKISEGQREAEQNRERQREIWDRLRELPVLGDMLLERPDRREPGTTPTKTNYYASYLKPYEEVLKLMRAQLLRGPSATG